MRRRVRFVVGLLLLFPLITLVVGGLHVATASYGKAREYEEAATGTMAGYESFSREDMDVLRARAMRHCAASLLLVPIGIVGLAGVFGELAGAEWTGLCLRRAGLLGLVCGAVQIPLLLGQMGHMWLLGVFTMLFGIGLLVFGRKPSAPETDVAP